MSVWSQLILELPRAKQRKAVKQWKDLEQFDGYGDNVVFLKFKDREEQRRMMYEIKDSINRLPEHSNQKYYAEWL